MDRQAQALTVREIPPERAAERLAGLEARDPRRLAMPGDLIHMARAGRCFEIGGDASCVYLLHVHDGAVWIEAAQGAGSVDLCAVLDAVVTQQAQGARCVGFMTERRGLVKKAQALGWHVAGWVMRKELHQ